MKNIRFNCDDSYMKDMDEYTEKVLQRMGVSSPMAEREIRYLTDCGNTVACKSYGDMIFYRKTGPALSYRDAFELYIRSAGIRIDESGEWQSSGRAFPPAFWMLGYYLKNYRRESFLKECPPIAEIDAMSLTGRLETALALAAACIRSMFVPAAYNLIGRILQEAAETEQPDAFIALVNEELAGRSFPESGIKLEEVGSAQEMDEVSGLFFEEAARGGYVYAGNNLAAREAAHIVSIAQSASKKELDECAERYIGYLKKSADRYEPYAANRLGLFYHNGEIKSEAGSVKLKEYVDPALAKEYFRKAVVCPDSSSAWAYFNLIKYFHNDYVTDIELLNEHMDRIRELSKEVYDLAMEL